MYMNGIRDLVTIHGFGLSDREGPVEFVYPDGHLGGGRTGRVGKPAPAGGSAVPARREGTMTVQSEVRVVDSVLPPGTSVDLVKIDVEGHELAVLKGMQRTIAGSPSIAILLEKLAVNGKNDMELYRHLTSFGLELHGVGAGATLHPLSEAGLRAWRGYVFAVRPQVRGPLGRSFFAIYPGQLRIPSQPAAGDDGRVAIVSDRVDELLFYGPYWRLERGTWRIRLEARLEGRVELAITGPHGQVLQRLAFNPGVDEQTISVDHDVMHFECVARAHSRHVRVNLKRIVFTRLG
jgi:FkbM family methyltransferase